MRLLVATVAFGLLTAAPASAATFTVNTTNDGAGCAATCTLRGALAAAAANGIAEDDTIVVPAGTYGVSSPLTTSTRVTIAGAGANTTIIRPVEGGRLLSVSGSAVVVRDVTLRDAIASTPGGNVLVTSQAALTLQRVRVTNGRGTRGGGIATQGAASLDVSASLIDGNFATASTINDIGGGIYIEGQTSPTVVTIQDSTITGNGAANAAGIGVVNNAGQPPTLRGVTLARNTARAGGFVGGIQSAPGARFQGSIVAGNLYTVNFGGGPQTFPSNCAQSFTDDGGNLESATDCGLAGHQNTDPQLAAALDGSQPPVLTIPATSPAVDIASCGLRTFDQRGVVRPQGVTCDAGAYEYQAPVVEPTPTPTPIPTVSATPTPTPTATPTATPVFKQTVVVREVRGRVRIRQPGSTKFVELDATRGIPLGSTVDTKAGRVELASEPGAGATIQRAQFFDGIFRVTQRGTFTELKLTEALASCRKASASARKVKKRKLWGSGSGKFRTVGQYSAATIRGTKWLTQDTCAGTLTKVTQGSVNVRDNVRKKTIIVRKGRSYLAKPRR